jgi:hypothetical protein
VRNFRRTSFLILMFLFVSVRPALAIDGDQLMEAAYLGHVKTLNFLLDHGVDVNFQDEQYGASALHAAAQGGREEIVKILLKRGADVNLKSKEGNTPLMAAAFNHHESVVKTLLAAGAEVNTKNQADETALSLAREELQEGIIQLLLQAGAKDIKKRCPNPNVKYKTWPVKDYWHWFMTGDVTEWVRGEAHLCVKYTHQYKNKRVNGAVLISLDQVDNRKEKEAGLISGIQTIFKESELFFQIFKMEEEDSSFYGVFVSRYMPRLEAVTGLKFKTPRQWFDWIQSNKDRLVLSPDGKYVIAR